MERWLKITSAGVALLLALTATHDAKGAAMDGKRTVPPIDREAPARVETATFAVG